MPPRIAARNKIPDAERQNENIAIAKPETLPKRNPVQMIARADKVSENSPGVKLGKYESSARGPRRYSESATSPNGLRKHGRVSRATRRATTADLLVLLPIAAEPAGDEE
jgi:hypothetical protein